MATKRRLPCLKVNKPKRKRRTLSRFGEFLRVNKIRPLHVADATGVSREHITRLRFGEAEPTRPMMIYLTAACRGLLGRKRRVRITELFDLGDGER